MNGALVWGGLIIATLVAAAIAHLMRRDGRLSLARMITHPPDLSLASAIRELRAGDLRIDGFLAVLFYVEVGVLLLSALLGGYLAG